MENKINPNFIRQYTKGQTIYSREDEVSAISLILKGSVTANFETYVYQYMSGGVVGIADKEQSEYLATYVADEDTVIYEFCFSDYAGFDELLMENDKYRGVIVSSVSKELAYLYQIYSQLIKSADEISDYITNLYSEYAEFCNCNGYEMKPSEILKNCDRESFLLEDLSVEMIQSYLFLSDLSLDTMKSYYSKADLITSKQVEDLTALVVALQDILPKIMKRVKNNVLCLMNHTDDCLYRRIALLALQVEQAGGANEGLIEWLDDIVKLLHKEDQFFRKYLSEDLRIDRKSMGDLYSTLMTCLKNPDKALVKKIYALTKDHDDILNSLSGLFEQLMQYAEYDEEKSKEFKADIIKYINLPDKSSSEDEVRGLRKSINTHYYAVYELIFLKAYHASEVPRMVELFLDYGVLDERLLSKEQLIFLYNCKNNVDDETPNVYTIRRWLTLVYEGSKEPSKNEFDLDYREYIQSQIKERNIRMDLETALSNREMRLHHEIENMFHYNQRLVFGQISSFVPMLCKDHVQQDLRRMMLSGKDIMSSLNEVIQIDYSAFYQEVLYTDPERGITKEYVMKNVLPDIIVLPGYGVNGSMWQETSSKKRDTPARFIIPLFTDHEMFHIFTKLCGRYRWEICRRLQGGVWNNIQYKSLTSEYMDYIQFYRKNRDLSEDKKDSIKLQIQKARNNTREVFTSDYENWIHYESKGGFRLNKVVREIFSTYCPFNREIRNFLMKQPIFQEAMMRFQRNTLKKARELESHMIAMEKSKIEIPKEISSTLAFYKEY